MAHAFTHVHISNSPLPPESLAFPSDLNARSGILRCVDELGLQAQARNIIADSRTVLEVMPRKVRFLKEDINGHREEVMNSLTRVIGAINTVKDLVPLEIGKTILSAASTILLAVKVHSWTILRNRSLNGLPFSKDTMKNKEDFRDLIDQCDKIAKLINRTIWEITEKQVSPMLDEALKDLEG